MYLYIIACWLLSALTSGITASPISDNDLSIRDSTTDSSFLNPLIAGFSQGKCPALVPVGLTKVLGCKTIVSGCIQGANSFYAAIGISPICVKQTDNYDPSAYTSSRFSDAPSDETQPIIANLVFRVLQLCSPLLLYSEDDHSNGDRCFDNKSTRIHRHIDGNN